MKSTIRVAAIFCAVFVGVNLCLFALHKLGLAFHYVPSWPINVFSSSEATRHHRIFLGALLFAAAFFLNRFLAKTNYKLPLVIVAGFILLLGSNFMQGWEAGFVDPITADEFNDEETPQYYHDAVAISDAGAFFRNYSAIQPTLHIHARTHPPGPVLLIFALLKTLRSPALISIAIAAVALMAGAFFFHRLLLMEVSARIAGFMTFLFLLLPAVQIYYLVTIDALVAALLLGVFYSFKRSDASHLVVSTVLLASAFMLTTISLWIVPVLLGFDLISRRNLLRSSVVIAAVIAVYLLIDLVSGFNIARIFTTASALENPNGFMLLHHSLDYFVTRLQCIGELVLFFGPYLLLLFARSIRVAKAETWLAIGSLLFLLLAGTFRVAETARICNFIYPFLLVPIARYLRESEITDSAMQQLTLLVFSQTILMQAAGSYFW